jgi:hypothetical protein
MRNVRTRGRRDKGSGSEILEYEEGKD